MPRPPAANWHGTGSPAGAVMAPSWLLWRMRFTGLENLPQTTPYVLAPVHRSYIDTLLAGYVSPRRVRFMGKEEMWRTPWVAKLFNSLGGFPVRRGTPDREALRICEQILAAGEPVVLFPEGSRQSGPIVQPLFARHLSRYGPTSPSSRSASAGANKPCRRGLNGFGRPG